MENNRNTRTITGIVYSAKKDHNGKVISVLIDSMDEDQEIYKVSPGRKSDKLLELINKKVEVYGSVSEDAKGDLIINVISFTLLEET
jgi:hypothetical protein